MAMNDIGEFGTGGDGGRDIALVRQMNEDFQLTISRDARWRRQASENIQFLLNDSWPMGELQKLEDERRPALSFNIIRPFINIFVGMQLAADTNIQVIATEPENDDTSGALEKQIRHIEFRSNYSVTKAACFMDGLVMGRGWREGYLDFSENPYGELKYRYVWPHHIRFDNYSKAPNLSDSRYLFRAKWFRPKDFRRLFPDAFPGRGSGTHVRPALFASWQEEEAKSRPASNNWVAVSDSSMGHRLLVVEYWWREMTRRWFAINTRRAAWEEFKTRAEADEFAQGNTDMIVVDRDKPVIRYILSSGDRFLSEAMDSPYGDRTFPYFPFLPYNAHGETHGVVEDMKDAQRMLNKTMSQVLHMLNQAANRTLMIPEGSVQDPQNAVRQFNTAGGHLVFDQAVGTPEWADPPKAPVEHFAIIDRVFSLAEHITGFTPALQGRAAGSREPAKAAAQRKQQSSHVLGPVVHAWLKSEETRGLWTIDAAQKLLPEPHTIRVINDQADPDEERIQTVQLNQPIETDEGIVIKNDITVGQYDVRIDHIEAQASVRQESLALLVDMARGGAPVPTDAIVRLMPGIPVKIKTGMIKQIKEMQQIAMQNPGAQTQV